MTEYHKIQTVFKRNPETNFKTLLEGEFSLPEFEYLKDNTWLFTEKVDGTNIRIIFDGTKLTFEGKTDQAQIPSFLVNKLAEKFYPQLSRFVEKFPVNEENKSIEVCLYGEGYGARIQGCGGNYRPDQDFVLFDIKIGHWWLQREDVEKIGQDFELDIVPIIGEGTLEDMINMTKRGFDSKWGYFLAEGIVARPKVELKSRSGHRIITKIKHKDFGIVK